MAVFDPSFTADKAASTLPADVLNGSGINPESRGSALTTYSLTSTIDARRKGKAGRKAPPELGLDKQFKEQRVRIFNVGPFPHTIPCGSIGTFFIPACPEDKEYVEMLTPLHVLEDEIYPGFRDREPKRLREEGRQMAIEVLGEGSHQNRRHSRRKVGVFIAEGEVPTKKELHDAKAQLHAYASEQILFMDSMWDRDRKLAYDIYRPETFGACARVLGLTGKEKGWLAQGEPSNKIKCEACHMSVDPDAPLCYNCKSPVNMTAYAEYRRKLKAFDEPETPAEPNKGKRG
jgi:hypothetical protein